MIGVAPVLPWLWPGLRESLAMIWMTWWPLVLGFGLSGLVQSVSTRDGVRARLGATTPGTVARSSLLGVLSSSCSYAASAMARAMFARGASWSNSLVFMVASTNLVIELGVLLSLMLGGRFLLAQLIGGVVMIIVMTLTMRVVFNVRREESLRARVLADAPPERATAAGTWRDRLRERDGYVTGARYMIGDLTMLRKELVAGFVVAGFLSVHVPASWWSHAFVSGHGAWTALENALLAPLVAMLACVCSIGNIPLAAALWAHGVTFGGVVTFIFADLLAAPLLLIYRRFYGAATTWRLLGLLWFAMSVAGLTVNGLFHVAHLLPSSHHLRVLDGDFPLGATLVLNSAAAVVLVAAWWLARRAAPDGRVATDPVCGMSVDVGAAAASSSRDGATYYFCSLRCRDRFERGPDLEASPAEEQVDPVCGMRVSPASAVAGRGPGGVTYYFCCEGCRATFLESPSASRTRDEGER